MSEGPGTGFSVLLVEDDPEQREVTRLALEQSGFTVCACPDGRSAVRAFNGGGFDAVLCDLGLPDLSGSELLRYVRLSTDRIAFLMLTGHDDVPTAVRSMRDGADEYLVKPAGPLALADSLLAAIRRRRQIAGSAERLRRAELAPLIGFMRGVQALVASLETKDPYTHGHSRTVADISLRIGRAMGLGRRALREIRAGALLHDIGKIGVPLSILHKQGRLSEDEWQVVKLHPEYGCRILEPLARVLPEVQRIVRHEHERWDGAGYPDGLAGEDIPLGSRLVMVADTYDAVCSTRPYRKALSKADALDIIRQGAGSQFDPGLVEPFERVLGDLPDPRD
ncbi:MAG: response regulator [Planctomycetota bacterium]|nr:MAG: response regulator [Planctomycetota bacterium]